MSLGGICHLYVLFHPPQSWPTSEGLKNWKLRFVESAPISAGEILPSHDPMGPWVLWVRYGPVRFSLQNRPWNHSSRVGLTKRSGLSNLGLKIRILGEWKLLGHLSMEPCTYWHWKLSAPIRVVSFFSPCCYVSLLKATKSDKPLWAWTITMFPYVSLWFGVISSRYVSSDHDSRSQVPIEAINLWKKSTIRKLQ